ncbi:MAG: TrmB family transcriptional regulator [Halobacteriaceae archaeon]
MDEADAVEALGRLGLSTYEARVFVALQKLGDGTASEIAAVADVPRSQVYGAADALEERGLVEVQHATPIRYRPVDPAEAETRLRAPLEAERERAIDYLESIQGSGGADAEREAEVWTVHGTAAVDDRLSQMAEEATDRLVLGIDDPTLFDPSLRATLEDRVAAGVAVTVASVDEAVLSAVPDGVETAVVPPAFDPGELATRVLVVDGDAVLLAVRGADETNEETAIWSAHSGFATVLARVVEAWFSSLRTD